VGRRPFLWPGLSLAGGILLGRFLSVPSIPVFLFILFLLPFLWAVRGKPAFLPLFILVLTGIGFLRMQQTLSLPSDHIAHFANGEWASLEGRIISLPELKKKGKREIHSFVLEAENLVRKREFFELKGQAQVFLFNPSEAPSYADKVRLRGRLVLPKTPRNPGEFDYRKYLAEQSIYAVLEGYGTPSLKKLSSSRNLFSYPLIAIQKLRNACARRLDSLFQFPINALLKALILGLRKDLPEDFRDDFMKTNTSHLVAISGMNITLVAGTVFFLALCLGFPQKAAALTGIFLTVTYVLLSGWGIPVVRAGWMACLFFVALLLEREKDLLNSLFFALFVILAFDPGALFQVGFQLSFLSVFSLATLAPLSLSSRYRDFLQTPIVMIGTFPVCIAYFNVFSWAGVLANLLAIPFFHLGVLAGMASLALGSCAVIGPFVTGMTQFFLKTGLGWIQFWSGQPWSYSYLRPPPWELLLLYYAALTLVWLVHRFHQVHFGIKALSISLWLLTAAAFFIPSGNRDFILTVFSVGQNELVDVEFPGEKHWLINTGRGMPSDQARWTLGPFLQRNGVRHIEGIILTDRSRRHTGGFPSLVGNFSIGSLLFPSGIEPWPDKKRRVPMIPVSAGDRVSVGGRAGFRVLDVTEGRVLLALDYQGYRFLMVPSWKSSGGQRILPGLEAISPIDMLILPAFGGPSDSRWEEALSLLLPSTVVFSKNNPRIGPLLKLLEQEEIPFFFLSETGALRFEVKQGQCHLSPYWDKRAVGV